VQQHKNEYQQNNVKHIDWLPEELIDHLSWSLRTDCKNDDSIRVVE